MFGSIENDWNDKIIEKEQVVKITWFSSILTSGFISLTMVTVSSVSSVFFQFLQFHHLSSKVLRLFYSYILVFLYPVPAGSGPCFFSSVGQVSILLAMQNHSTTMALASATSSLAGNVTPLSTSSNTASTSSQSSSSACHSSGNILSVTSFISTYCNLGNLSLCNPSIVGAPSSCAAGGATSGPLAIPGRHGSSLPLLGSSIPATATICAVLSLNRPFVVGPGYSPIPSVTKIWTGQFVDLADLLAENLNTQESEPHTYLDGKLLVSSSKKRVQEIANIITFTIILLDLLQCTPFQVAQSHSMQAANYQDLPPIPWESLAPLWHCLSEGCSSIWSDRLVPHESGSLQFSYSHLTISVMFLLKWLPTGLLFLCPVIQFLPCMKWWFLPMALWSVPLVWRWPPLCQLWGRSFQVSRSHIQHVRLATPTQSKHERH